MYQTTVRFRENEEWNKREEEDLASKFPQTQEIDHGSFRPLKLTLLWSSLIRCFQDGNHSPPRAPTLTKSCSDEFQPLTVMTETMGVQGRTWCTRLIINLKSGFGSIMML